MEDAHQPGGRGEGGDPADPAGAEAQLEAKRVEAWIEVHERLDGGGVSVAKFHIYADEVRTAARYADRSDPIALDPFLGRQRDAIITFQNVSGRIATFEDRPDKEPT